MTCCIESNTKHHFKKASSAAAPAQVFSPHGRLPDVSLVKEDRKKENNVERHC